MTANGLMTLNSSETAFTFLDQPGAAQGGNPPVLCVHCSGGTHRQWTRLADQVKGDFRVIAPDLHGHGGSPSPLPIQTTFHHDVEMVKALVRSVDGPLHLVGHSYGGFVALNAALELQDRLKSLTLIEPAAFHVLKESADPSPWEEINAVASRQKHQADSGDLDGSAAEFMAYWTGMTVEDARQQRNLSYIAKTMPSVAAIWEHLFHASRSLKEYASFPFPTQLIRGTNTTLAAREVANLLSQSMANLRVAEIEGAGHMAPLTHPEPVIAALTGFVHEVALGSTRLPA